ncbi:protein Z-dependent protease inhibitor-like [Periophthalmus magnuspinnatus]|uniref:protein Z-dependent protease inhibitor-like n=1 Tax=Periophthalmus magnuspinnatus TaxID=409849 RepID=UPI00145AE4E2|nr:protein Z-dependent protease inhibitor-like [Periophthalmus magnuspinnatus]
MRSMVLVLYLVLVQCWSTSWSQSVDPVQDLAHRWSDFGIRLFRSAASHSDQNLLLSPNGAGLSLSSVLERSAGSGREQLERALGLQGLQAADLVSRLRAAMAGGSLGGVAWFVAQGAEPDDAYRKNLEESFGADLRTVDFSSVQDSVDSIQRWVLEQTQDRVQIPSTGLDLGPDPQLVLASGLHIQARFSVPFNASQTLQERFFVDRYHTVMVSMMLTSGRFLLAYDRDLKTGVLRLGLDQGAAMLVLVPDEGVHVNTLEDELSAEKVQIWIQALKKTRLEVQLPRFALEQATPLKLNLKKLGVTQVFADNSLSQVLDSATLSVDETSVPGGVASSFKIPPPRLTVNRPFVFVVYHEATRTLQMIGRVVDPTQK